MRRLGLAALLLVPFLPGCASRPAALLPTVPVTILKEGPEAARPLPPPPPPAAAPVVPGDNQATPPPAADNLSLPAAAADAAPVVPADNQAPPRAAADNGAVAAGVPDNAALLPPPPPPPPPAEVYRKLYEEAIAATREAVGRREPLKAVPAWDPLDGTPWEREARFNRAVLHHLAGDATQAESRYRPLVEASPPHEGAAANLLGLLLMQGRAAEGAALVDRLFPPPAPPGGGAPLLPELAGNAAAVLLDAGRPERAAPFLSEKAFRGAPPPSAAWNRAVLAWKLGDGEGARKAAAALPPETAALWAVKASRPAWDRAELERRIASLEPPPPDDRRLPGPWDALAAWQAWRKGDGEGAERLLHRVEAVHPAEATAGLGLLLVEKGRWKEGREALEKTVRTAPSLPEGWLGLGIFRELYEGNGAAALECYRRYVTLGGSRKDEVGKWIEWLERSQSR